MKGPMVWFGHKALPPCSGLAGWWWWCNIYEDDQNCDGEDETGCDQRSSNSVFFARLPLTPLPPCTHLSSPTSFQCWRLLKGHGGTFGHFVILSLQCLRLQPPNFANPNLFIEPTFFPLFSLQLMGSNGRTGANTFAKEVTTPLAFWENKNIFGLGEIQDGEGSLPPTLHRRPQLRPRTAETLSASCQRYIWPINHVPWPYIRCCTWKVAIWYSCICPKRSTIHHSSYDKNEFSPSTVQNQYPVLNYMLCFNLNGQDICSSCIAHSTKSVLKMCSKMWRLKWNWGHSLQTNLLREHNNTAPATTTTFPQSKERKTRCSVTLQ